MEDNVGSIYSEAVHTEPFLNKMLSKVVSDYENGRKFLESTHRDCDEADEMYHNARKYKELTKGYEFPLPVIQVLVDRGVANLRDKLFYAKRPCSVVGVEDTDKADADAKQAMIDWQDYKDHIAEKIKEFIKDGYKYPYIVAQVDYEERYRKAMVIEDVMVPVDAGVDWSGMGVDAPMVQESRWVNRDVLVYKGPVVKRIAPTDLFFGPEKHSYDDGYPLMVRSYHEKDYFYKPYFMNQDMIKDVSSSKFTTDKYSPENIKRDLLGLNNSSDDVRIHEYIEWQGNVRAKELYEYLGKDLEGVGEHDVVNVLCGVVDGGVVVRLQEDPLELGYPNIVVGKLDSEGGEFMGNSIVMKASPAHKGSQKLMGILLENFKQSVNAMHVINTTALTNKMPLINTPGAIIETNTNVNSVHKRIEQPAISQDIYALISMFKNVAEEASGQSSMVGGRGDVNSETLGEANIVNSNSELQLRDLLRTFEETFVQPLYEMRNSINVTFIDQAYAYGVIGEGAIDWRSISPEQIRSRVDFLCEGSTRETNKGVIVQQMLQALQLAPTLPAVGIPVRVDVLFADLLKDGFGFTTLKVEKILPLLAAERQTGSDISADVVMQQMLAMRPQVGQDTYDGAGNPNYQGGDIPVPMSNEQNMKSVQARQGTKVGTIER